MKLGTLLQVAPQDLYVETTTAQTDLGATTFTEDGRAFRYAKAGGVALVAGTLLQSSAEVTGNENIAVAAAAIGDTSVVTTGNITATANELAGGYLVVSVTPGIGTMYLISGNTAASAAVATIYLAEPLRVALTTSSRVDIIKPVYGAVIINPATFTGVPVGVAIRAQTAATYGWIQVAGVASILADGAIAVSAEVVASNATAGAVETQVAGTSSVVQPWIGHAVTGISTTEVGAVRLFGLW